MAKLQSPCPNCGIVLQPHQMRREGKLYFRCPSCNEKLRISTGYMRFLRIAGLILSLAVPAVLRIQDPVAFIAVAVVSWLPVTFIFTTWMRNTFPPRIARFYPESSDLSLTGGPRDDG